MEEQHMDLFETADIVIYIKGKGVVVKEKSLLAYDMISKKVVAVGNDAEDMIKNPQENIKVISPLRRGMIADYVAAVELLRFLFIKAWGKKPLIKQPVSLCVPKEITDVEKKAFLDALYQSGAKELFITDIPMEQLLRELPNLPKNWQNFMAEPSGCPTESRGEPVLPWNFHVKTVKIKNGIGFPIPFSLTL